MKPKLSVVIPTFNSRTYVVECVASALNQTYSNIEVIVDDNISHDGTPQLLNEVFGSDPRFKLFANKEDLNIPKGWNRGMLRASGEYILLLHSDNLLHPQYAEALAEVSKQFQPEVIYSESAYFQGETPKGLFNEIASSELIRKGITYLTPGSRSVDYIFRFQRMVPTSAVAIHRSCFENRPPFDPIFLWDPDIELMTWLAQRFSVTHIHQSLAAIRTHDGQAASWKDPTFANQYRDLLLHANEAGQSGIHQFLLHWSWSNHDICQKLAKLKQVPLGTFMTYERRWLHSEWKLFSYFFKYFLTRMRLWAQYIGTALSIRMSRANP